MIWKCIFIFAFGSSSYSLAAPVSSMSTSCMPVSELRQRMPQWVNKVPYSHWVNKTWVSHALDLCAPN